jgi:hypothetical protein
VDKLPPSEASGLAVDGTNRGQQGTRKTVALSLLAKTVIASYPAWYAHSQPVGLAIAQSEIQMLIGSHEPRYML